MRAVKYEAWGAVVVEEVEVEVVEEAEAAGSLTGGEADHRQHVVHAHLQPQLQQALQPAAYLNQLSARMRHACYCC